MGINGVNLTEILVLSAQSRPKLGANSPTLMVLFQLLKLKLLWELDLSVTWAKPCQLFSSNSPVLSLTQTRNTAAENTIIKKTGESHLKGTILKETNIMIGAA